MCSQPVGTAIQSIHSSEITATTGTVDIDAGSRTLVNLCLILFFDLLRVQDEMTLCVFSVESYIFSNRSS